MSARARIAPLAPAIDAELRRLRAAGASLSAIAASLNRRGIPARGGGRWYAAAVRMCLLNDDASAAPDATHQPNPWSEPCSA